MFSSKVEVNCKLTGQIYNNCQPNRSASFVEKRTGQIRVSVSIRRSITSKRQQIALEV